VLQQAKRAARRSRAECLTAGSSPTVSPLGPAKRGARGFTLIELMISVAILGIVSIYMFESFAVNQRAYTVIDQVAESQQNIRAIADLLERDLRHAGLMVPEGTAVCGVDDDASPDLLYVSDANAIDPGDDVATYDGALIGGGVTQVSDGTFSVSTLVMEPAPSRPAYDTDANGVADSDFQVLGGVIVLDSADPSRGTACGRVTNVDLAGSQVTIDLQSGGLAGLGAGAQLVVVPAHEYRIANGDQLLRDGVLLSEGVEDLQVAYFLDADTDNAVDAGEIHGDGVAPSADYVASAQDGSLVREVRVNLVTRTRMEDREWTQGRTQAMENRALGVANDGFRRRTYTSTVMLRNVGTRSL
jgi:prepilin-type N-terminal cleavage/methylation domain-containing protein